MARNYQFLFVCLTLLGMVSCSAPTPSERFSIRGTVTAAEGPLEGAYVGAHGVNSTFTTYVMTDSRGQFSFRDLAPGSYQVFTRISGFRTVEKDNISVPEGSGTTADFQVEPETEFLKLVDQASNSELLESFPGTQQEKEALFARCDGCHGAYYIAKSRFTKKDWLLIVSKMKSAMTTPVGDISPPGRRGRTLEPGEEDYFRVGEERLRTDDESIAEYLSRIRGPESPDFPIQFQPRPTGDLTRAVVTEYQIARPWTLPHDVLVDPRGRYVWYNEWRLNYFGRIDTQTGEMKDYPIPGRDDRPPGFLTLQWDHEGNLWGGQLWSGRAVKFDVKAEKFIGSWDVPQEWARTGTVGVCRHAAHPDGPVWIDDALFGTHWILNPETGKAVEHDTKGSRFACDSKGNIYSLQRGSKAGVVKTEPGTKKMVEYVAPTPNADPHRLTLDGDENVWYGDWEHAKITYVDTKTGKVTEYDALTPWSRVYNAVGDHTRKVGWAVPHVSDRMMKADANTGQVVEFPLPSRGHAVRDVDIDMSANPPVLWFVNQRNGRIVRFQEYVE